MLLMKKKKIIKSDNTIKTSSHKTIAGDVCEISSVDILLRIIGAACHVCVLSLFLCSSALVGRAS